MWLLGLVVGAILGGFAGAGGALMGAAAGALAGWALSGDRVLISAKRLRGIEYSIERLTRRLEALEQAALVREQVGAEAVAEAPPASGELEPDEIVQTAQPQQQASGTSGEALSQEAQGQVPDQDQPGFASEPTAAPPKAWLRQQPSKLWYFFFGPNALVRFGLIVLFFGIGFLLKYAAEHVHIPIEARLMGVALVAIALLVIGWRVRLERPGYGVSLQGGGIGVLYLTVFAAFRLYELLPAGVALVLLTAMAVFSAMLAVMQDSRSLAAMGVSGGFLAPLLASTGAGSHVMLFSFYALLNGGIVLIAWHKAWRELNLLGFVFTFVIGLMWGNRYYRADLFASTEPFLILFFLAYVTIAVLFAIRQDASVKSRVDGTLVFGTPLIAFGMQSALVRDMEYGAAFSALGLSFFYLLLAKLLYARGQEKLRLLVEAFVALGVVFGTLAIPLALDGRWTSGAWALEGAAIVWAGVRQEKALARAFGLLLQFAAGLALLLAAPQQRAAFPVLNSFYLGGLFVSGGGLFCAWYLRRQREKVTEPETLAANALFIWGALWWFGAGLYEIREHVQRLHRVHAILIFVIGSCAGFSLLCRRLVWQEARYVALALLPLMYALAAVDAARAQHPLEQFGYIAWPLAFGAHLWLLSRHEAESRFLRWRHAAGLWLLAWLGSWEIAWQISTTVPGEAWRLVGWALAPALLLAWLTARGERLAWPVARHPEAYLCDGAIPIVVFLWLWMHWANLYSAGDAAPLPYLPLVNPLDIVQALALMVQFAWFQRIRRARFAPPDLRSSGLAYAALGTAAFVWLNGILLRTLHHWAGVTWTLDAVLRSMLVQAAVSIFWSALALCAMLTATRLRWRPLWLAGAGLMAVVVVKLFFIDLSNVGGIERVVSFIGVGVLMLVIGYLSPVPPATVEEGK